MRYSPETLLAALRPLGRENIFLVLDIANNPCYTHHLGVHILGLYAALIEYDSNSPDSCEVRRHRITKLAARDHLAAATRIVEIMDAVYLKENTGPYLHVITIE